MADGRWLMAGAAGGGSSVAVGSDNWVPLFVV